MYGFCCKLIPRTAKICGPAKGWLLQSKSADNAVYQLFVLFKKIKSYGLHSFALSLFDK
jgi:hypothetical protein